LASKPQLSRRFEEGAVILFSILLAFAVDAWWQDRGDIRLERDYLVGLLSELEDSRLELDSDLVARAELELGLERLIMSSDGSPPPPVDSARATLGRARTTRQFAPVRSVFDDLVSSGRLQLLRSDAIRAGLLIYAQALDKNALTEQVTREFVADRFAPYLSQRVPLDAVSLGELVQVRPGELGFEGAGTGGARALSRLSLSALVEDDLFRNLLIERREMVARVLGRNREVSILIDNLRDLVRQELAS